MHKPKTKQRGFTIIELIIVMVILSLLAGVSIFGFRGIQSRAGKTAVQVGISNTLKQLEYLRSQNGVYPSNLSGFEVDEDVILQYTYNSSDDSYCLTASNNYIDYYGESSASSYNQGTCSGHVAYSGNVDSYSMASVGDDHACGLFNGSLYCWGNNAYGQLGDGTTTNSPTPVAVVTSGVLDGLTITAIAAGGDHTCVMAGSQPYCWGRNSGGQLGDNSTTNSSVPLAVDISGALSGLNVTQISAGSAHTCAVADGAIYCWGDGGYGRLGNGSSSSVSTPTAVTMTGVMSGKTATYVDPSTYNTCAIADGEAFCWGYGSWSSLGNGSTSSSSIPVAVVTSGVLSGKTVTRLSNEYTHSCAVADGEVFCWGRNAVGQIGDGTTTNRSSPVAVDTSGVLNGKTVTDISGAGNHSCAVADGQYYCWGYGVHGQLGNGPGTNSYTPVAVDMTGDLNGRVAQTIDGAGDYTCGMASDDLFCWGRNQHGQIGNGTTTNQLTPLLVAIP